MTTVGSHEAEVCCYIAHAVLCHQCQLEMGTAPDGLVHRCLLVNVLQQQLIVLQIHDEVVLNVPKSELEEVKKLVKEDMESVIKLSVPLKVEIDTGTNWYEAK